MHIFYQRIYRKTNVDGVLWKETKLLLYANEHMRIENDYNNMHNINGMIYECGQKEAGSKEWTGQGLCVRNDSD